MYEFGASLAKINILGSEKKKFDLDFFGIFQKKKSPSK